MKLDCPLKCKTPLHLKSRGKHIGRWSQKKKTKRVTTTVIACSEGTSLPPLSYLRLLNLEPPQNSSPNLPTKPKDTKVLIAKLFILQWMG